MNCELSSSKSWKIKRNLFIYKKNPSPGLTGVKWYNLRRKPCGQNLAKKLWFNICWNYHSAASQMKDFLGYFFCNYILLLQFRIIFPDSYKPNISPILLLMRINHSNLEVCFMSTPNWPARYTSAEFNLTLCAATFIET